MWFAFVINLKWVLSMCKPSQIKLRQVWQQEKSDLLKFDFLALLAQSLRPQYYQRPTEHAANTRENMDGKSLRDIHYEKQYIAA